MKRFFLIALTLVIAVGVVSQLRYLIPVLELRDHNPDDTAFMERAREHGAVRYEWRDYEQIADDLKRAVLIAEDARVMEHIGCDGLGIRHAIERNEEAGHSIVFHAHAPAAPWDITGSVDTSSRQRFILPPPSRSLQRGRAGRYRGDHLRPRRPLLIVWCIQPTKGLSLFI